MIIRFTSTATNTSHRLYLDRVGLYHITEEGGSGGVITPQQIWEYGARTLTGIGPEPIIPASKEEIATQVRTELTIELNRIDTTISSIASASKEEIATQVRTELTTELDRIDSTISSIASASKEEIATQVRTELTIELDRIDIASSNIKTDVWTYPNRKLTSAENIVLTKDVGIIGFNDLSSAQLISGVSTVFANVGLDSTVILRLDVPISSRMADSIIPNKESIASTVWSTMPFTYVAPNNTILDNIYNKVVNLPIDPASQTAVTSIHNSTDVVLVVPQQIQRPTSGSITYNIEVYLYDPDNNMMVPDSIPTVILVNNFGIDRSSRLSTVNPISAGRYRLEYLASSTDAAEQLHWNFTIIKGGITKIYGATTLIVDTVAVDFDTVSSAKLDALYTRLTDVRAMNLDFLDQSISSSSNVMNLGDIAIAVRDVSNINPAPDSLGAAINGVSKDEIANAVWVLSRTGLFGDGTFGEALNAIRNLIQNGKFTATALSLGGGGGSGTIGAGAIEYIYHVKDYNNVPLENVDVWVTSDIEGRNIIAGTFITDDYGDITLLLNPGSYYVWCQLPGYNFNNPDRIIVTESMILQS